jgi:hypothetical protein
LHTTLLPQQPETITVLTGTILIIGEAAMTDITDHTDMVPDPNQTQLSLKLPYLHKVTIIHPTILIPDTIHATIVKDAGAGKPPVFSFFGGEIK